MPDILNFNAATAEIPDPSKLFGATTMCEQHKTMLKEAGSDPLRLPKTSSLVAFLIPCLLKIPSEPDRHVEQPIGKPTSSNDFQTWSHRMSGLLTQSPKREVYLVSG